MNLIIFRIVPKKNYFNYYIKPRDVARILQNKILTIVIPDFRRETFINIKNVLVVPIDLNFQK